MEKENSLMWCYIGENKDQVMMTCSKEDWENIIKIIEWAKNRLHQDRGDYVPDIHESDEWNYDYTRRNN